MFKTGKIIKALRKQRDMTAEALAEYLQCSSRTVQRYENDQSLPDPATLMKLSELFDVTSDFILGLSPVPASETNPCFVCRIGQDKFCNCYEIRNIGGIITNVEIKFFDIMSIYNTESNSVLYFFIQDRYFMANESTENQIQYDYDQNKFNIYYNEAYYKNDEEIEKWMGVYSFDQPYQYGFEKILVISYNNSLDDFNKHYYKIYNNQLNRFEHYSEIYYHFRYMYLCQAKGCFCDTVETAKYLFKCQNTIIIQDKSSTEVFFNYD